MTDEREGPPVHDVERDRDILRAAARVLEDYGFAQSGRLVETLARRLR